jgi:hypothetical protein
MQDLREEDYEKWQFWTLAKKFAKHVAEEHTPQDECLICEAFRLITEGQGEVSDYLTGKIEAPF